MIEAVGRAVSIETETIIAIWILSWRSSRLCKGKLMVLETRMDKESSRGIGMRLLAPRLNNRNLTFFGSLAQWPWKGVIFFLLTFLMLCCIFSSPVYFHFTTDYTLYDCVCDE